MSSHSSSTQRRPNRGPAAAQDNRRALIAAAREVYAERGLAAPFSAVARRAGVGQGSLYRHFPDRIALAVAVFDENMAEIEKLVTAEGAVVDLMALVTDLAVDASALIELITDHREDPRVAPIEQRFVVAVSTVVKRDRLAGRINEQVDEMDVSLAVSMLSSVVARAEPERRAEVARRARALFGRALV